MRPPEGMHIGRDGDPDLPAAHGRAGVQRHHPATVIVLGLWNTVIINVFGHCDYREGVSVWFRGIFRLSLHPS